MSLAAGGDSSGEEGGLQIDVGRAESGAKKEAGKPGKKKATKEEPAVWKSGDIVWAKVSGFNYWPAKVSASAGRL